jgi:fatty acid desaturase
MDLFLWLGGLAGFATLGVLFYGTWWAVPCFAVYGLLYGSGADARWHEYGHGTAFRTSWLNSFGYQLGSFMNLQEPTLWRWSHARHHTDTLVVGRDPEIDVMRPARLARIIANFFGLVYVPLMLARVAYHTTGRITSEEATFLPATEIGKVVRVARFWLVIYAAMIAACIASASMLPFLLVLGPRFYGACLGQLFVLTQHSGLGEDVLDHRLNTRTVLMNPVFRFLYLNMNYHVEHHMFPLVPYHKLPALHEEVKGDLVPACPSLFAAYREIVPAVIRQLRDQTYYIHRELPAGSDSYHGSPPSQSAAS